MDRVIQQIKLQATKNTIGHYFKLQANKIKVVMVYKGNAKIRQIKKSYGIRTKPEIESNDIKIKENIGGNRNVNVMLV